MNSTDHSFVWLLYLAYAPDSVKSRSFIQVGSSIDANEVGRVWIRRSCLGMFHSTEENLSHDNEK